MWLGLEGDWDVMESIQDGGDEGLDKCEHFAHYSLLHGDV